MEPSIEKWVNKIQPRIKHCMTCQPYDGGDVIWILGRRIDLDEIYDEYEVPVKKRDIITANLSCLGCGRELCQGDEVGVATEDEIKEEKKKQQTLNKWRKKYEPALDDFQEYLERYPYLGMLHKMGKELYEQIEDFPCAKIVDEIWYRARKVECPKELKSDDMYANPEPQSEGRFSHYGQSVFYLASSADTAADEVLNLETEDLAWIQSFKLKKQVKILNLYDYTFEQRKDIPVLAVGLVREKLNTYNPPAGSVWKPQYFIPRFIADCAKAKGLNGIMYYSAKCRGKNLVLFNYSKKSVIPYGKPEIKSFTKWVFKGRLKPSFD